MGENFYGPVCSDETTLFYVIKQRKIVLNVSFLSFIIFGINNFA